MLSESAPVTGNPASHPVTGSPPSGMKAPTRLPKPSARREPTCPDGPACEANRALCERRAGESCRAPDPRPKNPRSSGTSRCTPNATPDAPLVEEISGGLPAAGRRFREHHSATLHYGQIGRVAPKHPSRHSRHASDCPKTTTPPSEQSSRKKLAKPRDWPRITSRFYHGS